MLKRIMLVTLLAATPAAAHDWYPMECCHEQDCAPVDHAEIVTIPSKDGSKTPGTLAMIVTTKHGKAVVSENLPRRESRDSKMHACMMPNLKGQMTLICIFMPPAM